MPSPNTNPSPGPPAASNLTAEDVIGMFRDQARLRVCDDQDDIEREYDAQCHKYQDQSNTGTPRDRDRADRWFSEMTLLRDAKRRAEVIKIVYRHFQALADTALSAAVATGNNRVNGPVLENLRRLLHDSCYVDDELARRFLDDYVRERGLELEGPIVKAKLASQFVAQAGIGQIELRWALPADSCDAVCIDRDPKPARKGKRKADEVVYQGTGTAFTDRDVAPGLRYTYRAYSVYMKERSTGYAEASALCLAESEAQGEWRDGAVEIIAVPPATNTEVIVFRRAGGAPEVEHGRYGLIPKAGTEQIPLGPDHTLRDTQVAEGITYHYKFFTVFAPDLISQGVALQPIKVPKAPPAVPELRRSYQHDAGQNVVVLEWQPVRADGPVTYAVVRREGSAAPGHVKDGTLLDTVGQTRYLDHSVTAGRRYTYAVFTQVGDNYSRSGAAAAFIDIVAEVTNLTAEAGAGTVQLSWRSPANVSRIVIRRSLNPPHNHADGALVPWDGGTNAKDTKLHNGRLYHYLVCCAYLPDGTTEVYSQGVRVSAVPEELPTLATDFSVRQRGREVLCIWSPSAHGQVVILRSPTHHGLTVGHRLPAAELDRLGERIVTTEAAQAEDTAPDQTKRYYSIFTVAGHRAVAGEVRSCVVVPDITGLRVTKTSTGCTLEWDWPNECRAAVVVRRLGAAPVGPNDPQAVIATCSRAEYDAKGGKFVDHIQQAQGEFHYAVYGKIGNPPTDFFSPGTGGECRAVLVHQETMTMRYRLSAAGGKSPGGNGLTISWQIENPRPGFAGFVWVANQANVPTSPVDGVEILRWEPDAGVIAGNHTAVANLNPVRERRWARFFCKAMAINPAQRQAVLIVHPNVCDPIAAGPTPSSAQPVPPIVYDPRVPRTVICPQCFKEFPPGEMLFASYSGGNPVRAKYTFWDRIRGRPVRPPRSERGEIYARKLCPKLHDLPSTAATGPSHVIGIIGAKRSGKTHYIASLIERLKSVGTDFGAALMALGGTEKRYLEEFHNPLFVNHLELELTVGAPPPLIYDLTLDGRPWGQTQNRAVTLALYDTAGENLQKPERVREMVKYLRVASGVIFLIDPLQSSHVRDAIPPTVRKPEFDPEAEADAIIGRVLTELQQGKVLEANAPLTIPIAVVLTKCDLLTDAGLLEANRLWSSDMRHIGFFNREAHADMSGMFGECMQRWSPAAYANVNRRFLRHAFFGASATGCAADQKTGRYRYVSPWRVEDPLLWMLAELGVIPSQ